MRRILAFVIISVLIFAVAVSFVSCGKTETASNTASVNQNAEEIENNGGFAEKATLWLEDRGIPQWLIPFIISLFPILELRAGLIAAKLVGMDLVPAFIICYIGNMIPIPFILLFIKKIFNFLRDKKFFGKIVQKLENRAKSKSDAFKRGEAIGVFLFVGIPIPGTGGWTGSLIASLLDMPVKKSFPIIAAGVFVAGLIVSLIMYGVVGAFI